MLEHIHGVVPLSDDAVAALAATRAVIAEALLVDQLLTSTAHAVAAGFHRRTDVTAVDALLMLERAVAWLAAVVAARAFVRAPVAAFWIAEVEPGDHRVFAG